MTFFEQLETLERLRLSLKNIPLKIHVIKKLLDLLLVILLAILQKHKYRLIRCLYVFLEYGAFPDISDSANP